jgi:peptidyl-prolyl cis-trans isomerase SurA
MRIQGLISAVATACAALAASGAAALQSQQSPSAAPPPAAAQPQSQPQAPAQPQKMAYAGPASGVAAIVNDKVITTYDVQQRMKLMMLSSGRPITQEMVPQYQLQAVRDLIQEQLKLAEAKKFDVEVEEREIEGELADMAAQGGVTVEQLGQQLALDGISLDGLRTQIKATLVWQQLVQGRYRSRIRVRPEDIDKQLERMREDVAKEQFLVSEICIPINNPAQAEDIYRGSLQLIEQIRRGVPFSVAAQQFSACPTAAGGGDLGWVRSGELEPELNSALAQLSPGSVTNPIPSEGAFVILGLRDRREAAQAGEPTFTLAYASAPLSMGRNDALLALQKLKTADACNARALRQDLGPNIGVTRLENVKLADIDERFHSAVADLKRGDLSAPIEVDGAFHEVYVCEKDEGLGLPSRSALEDRAMAREFGRMSMQYLRDIERKSMIDIRLKPERPAG